MNVYLTPLGHALGARRESLADAAGRGRLVSEPALLHDAGFAQHHVAADDEDAATLARAACRALAGAVDAIVFATALPHNAASDGGQRFRDTGDVRWLMDYSASRLQRELGSDAAVIGLGQQACTGALGAIRIARSLVLAGECARVLCVTADHFPHGARYEQAFNLISDGAAACVVGAEPGPFAIRGTAQITRGALALASDEATVGSYFAQTVATVRRACGTHGAPCWLVTQNTHRNANRVLASLLGLDETRLWCPTRAQIGHVVSADNLINLEQLEAARVASPGELIALPMAGYGANWQCIALEAVA